MTDETSRHLTDAELSTLDPTPGTLSWRLVRDLRKAREILEAVDGAELYGYLPDAIEEDIRAFLGGPSAEAGHG